MLSLACFAGKCWPISWPHCPWWPLACISGDASRRWSQNAFVRFISLLLLGSGIALLLK